MRNGRKMRKIIEIIVHCSATRPSQNIGVDEIRHWHVKGRGWSDVGYHYIINRQGIIELGRPIEKQGAHTSGHNKNTIGICLVGGIHEENTVTINGVEMPEPEDNFTISQYDSLVRLLKDLKLTYGIEKINPHNKYAAKACPSFDLYKFLEVHKI